MQNQITLESLEALEEIVIPIERDYTLLIVENFVLVVILIATFMLLKYSKRPGTLLMFFGTLIFSLLGVAILPLVQNTSAYSGSNAWLINAWPWFSIAAATISAAGIYRFALSFKNES